MISLSCYIFCLRHMMSLSLRGSLSKLPLAGAKGISVILPALLNALPATLSCTCRIDLLENPEAGAKCPDWLEKKCGVGVSMRRGLGRVSMSLRQTAVRVLCLRLLWPAQTGCELTVVHLRQSTGFTRSAFFLFTEGGEKGRKPGEETSPWLRRQTTSRAKFCSGVASAKGRLVQKSVSYPLFSMALHPALSLSTTGNCRHTFILNRSIMMFNTAVAGSA